MIKQAVILAAGEGQRLRPFTVTKPKTMLSIAGKPILQYVVESLARNGVRKIIIVAGYRREQVFNYMGTGEKFGVSINYLIQEKQLGTAHALMQAKDFVDDEFLVLPGDNLIEANTIAKFVAMEPQSLLVKTVENNARYGVITTDDRNNVISIEEKPKEAERDIINTGIYAFNRDVFNHIDNRLGIPDVINNMIAVGYTFCAQETDGTWLDVVYPWDILGLNNAILRRLQPSLAGTIETGSAIKGMVTTGKNTVIHSNSYIMGPVVIGENCEIGPNVCIMPATSIGDNVVISPFSSIVNSVISKDVNIGPGSIIEDSVIDESCFIQGRFTASSDEVELRINDEFHKVKVGAMLGVGCNLKNSVVAQPGVIIGNYCQSQSMKLLSGKIPDRSIIY
jgi:UDP-N-acetylglucosamine diphosphorylase / glucose-1-phosphate thymidylyltransferase / UDP-N-acetylgalactosamine diphosphorylase / glucosamine-1-phosphate N-acetyltransferase / galactosamine-1-phosphate N-acetyltransferase